MKYGPQKIQRGVLQVEMCSRLSVDQAFVLTVVLEALAEAAVAATGAG